MYKLLVNTELNDVINFTTLLPFKKYKCGITSSLFTENKKIQTEKMDIGNYK